MRESFGRKVNTTRHRRKMLFSAGSSIDLQNYPGVFAATETSSYPPYTWGWTTVIVQGKTPPQNRNTASIMCSEGYFQTLNRSLLRGRLGYFQTLNRSLLRGRLFTHKDIEAAAHVVVVNQ